MSKDEKFKLDDDIASMLGFDSEFESKEAFKTAHEEKFIIIKNIDGNKEILDPIFGKLKGSVETKLKSTFKKLGVEFEADEIKGKKLEEIIELGAERVETNHTAKFDDFKTSFEGDGKEEIEKLQGQLLTKDKEHKARYEEIQGLNTDLKDAIENKDKDHATSLKQRDLDLFTRQAFDKVTWAKESDSFDLKLTGFKAQFADKYTLDLDDERNLLITDKEGKQIKNPEKVGEFEGIDTILEREAKEAGLLKINKNGGQQTLKSNGMTVSDDNATTRHITLGNR